MARFPARPATKRPSGHPFEEGDRKGGDRRAGVSKKFNREVKGFLRALVSDPEVQDAIRDQIISGQEGAAQLFLGAVAHVLGKPRESVEVSITPSSRSAYKRRTRGSGASERPLSRPAAQP